MSLDEAIISQIQILEALVKTRNGETKRPVINIDDLGGLSGIKEAKDIQRFLFILEGQKLVTPVPEGDLTSKIWQITLTGADALSKIHKRKLGGRTASYTPANRAPAAAVPQASPAGTTTTNAGNIPGSKVAKQVAIIAQQDSPRRSASSIR